MRCMRIQGNLRRVAGKGLRGDRRSAGAGTVLHLSTEELGSNGGAGGVPAGIPGAAGDFIVLIDPEGWLDWAGWGPCPNFLRAVMIASRWFADTVEQAACVHGQPK